VAHLDKYRRKWRQKIRGFFDQVFNTNTGMVDQDAMSMVADAESAVAEINSGAVAQGYYTSVVVLMDENREELEALALRLEKAINALGPHPEVARTLCIQQKHARFCAWTEASDHRRLYRRVSGFQAMYSRIGCP
jgi:hypothetical protein